MKEDQISELKSLRNSFTKSAEILTKVINLVEEEEKTEDKNRKEEIEKEIDELYDQFLVQMIKINKIK